jgi:glycosyltransferase involved in cell wall biosynthesis
VALTEAGAVDVSVVVPCHGAAGTVPALLRSLAAQTLAPERFEVLLADPGADGTRQVAERVAAELANLRVRVVASPMNGGPAAKRNAGAREAAGALLAFTDADCLPEPGWLEAGLAAFEAGGELIQGPTWAPEGEVPGLLSHSVLVGGDHGLHETCNMFYERRLFESLGGFSGGYFSRYGQPFGEDAELGWRARRSGAAYRFEPAAVVRHPVSPADLRRHLREQWLARGFPELARDIPELRGKLFYRRLFLSKRSAGFALAMAGAVLARRVPAAALLGLPYLSRLPAQRPAEVGQQVLSDAVTLAALAYGSARARRLVL